MYLNYSIIQYFKWIVPTWKCNCHCFWFSSLNKVPNQKQKCHYAKSMGCHTVVMCYWHQSMDRLSFGPELLMIVCGRATSLWSMPQVTTECHRSARSCYRNYLLVLLDWIVSIFIVKCILLNYVKQRRYQWTNM